VSLFSWLDPLSRRNSYDLPVYQGYEGADPGDTVPPLFIGARPPTYERRPKPLARIPVQRPHDRTDDQAVEEWDHNDFLVMGDSGQPDAKILADAQRFLVFLFALRRSTIFTSSMRERIYNIWLPPGSAGTVGARSWPRRTAASGMSLATSTSRTRCSARSARRAAGLCSWTRRRTWSQRARPTRSESTTGASESSPGCHGPCPSAAAS
jgi:hypothetical protein